MLKSGLKTQTFMTKHILQATVGSTAYGLSTSTSDVDYMGIVVPPIDYYIGIKTFGWGSGTKVEKKENEEYTFYELKKFISLAIRFNPNVIPLLFLKEEFYNIITPEGKMLLDCRDAFLSKNAIKPLLGYAGGQKDRIFHENTEKLGENRKQLVKKFGYDTKYAMHTLRILNMAKEFFETGKLNVFRENEAERKFLISVKEGKYSLEEWFQFYFDKLDEVYQASEHVSLPDEPDYEKINEICINIIFSCTNK